MPQAKIIFDLFHVVSNFNRVIDKVRNSEFNKASEEDKAIYKGTKYLLLKNRENLKSPEQRQHLKDLLALNKTISTVMILKEKLKHIWTYRSRAWAEKALNQWCELILPRKSGHRVKPQEGIFHTPAGLGNQLMSDVFFGYKRFQCNKICFESLLICLGTGCG